MIRGESEPVSVQHPYDLIVYQLGNDSCHDYMWPYLVRHPGLVVLHDGQTHQARARTLPLCPAVRITRKVVSTETSAISSNRSAGCKPGTG